VVFRHITVPVVSRAELGKAAKRLALKPTITDPGRVTSEKSAYDLSGSSVTDNNPCPQVISDYECRGAVTNISPLSSALISTDGGFDPEVFQLSVRTVQDGSPAGCDAIGDSDLVANLDIAAAGAYPGSGGGGDWGVVTVHTGLRPRFYALLDKRKVEFTEPIGPAVPCAAPQFPEDRCKQTITGTAHIVMQRLLLHRTKKRYAK
jgi:hypothetical protein